MPLPCGRLLMVLTIGLVIYAALPLGTHAKNGEGKTKDRVARDFRHADSDGDGFLSRAEWKRRGNFDRLDADGSDGISVEEFRAIYQGHDRRYDDEGLSENKGPVTIDPSIASNLVKEEALSPDTVCGLVRHHPGCSIDDAIKNGLSETGIGPEFPKNASCPGIDDYWAMNYSHKRDVENYHGGIDIPVPWGTPVRAVADGSVVAIFGADNSKRGIEIILRHNPQQTGLPFWSYSAYGHLDQMPSFEIGQTVKMAQVVGATGNSGIAGKGDGQSRNRRPAIHLAIFYSTKPAFGIVNNIVVPMDGYWLDPVAFYRRSAPFDSASLMTLPDDEKFVDIPVMFEDGTRSDPQSQAVWPYVCKRQ